MKLQSSVTKIIALFLMALIVSGCGGAEGRKAKYLERGKAYLKQENYDKARIGFRNVLQTDPKHAEAYYMLGLTAEAGKNWQQAFGNYSKAVELNPDYIDARAKLGVFFLLMGNLDKATEMTDMILSKQPSDPSGRIMSVISVALSRLPIKRK